MIKKLGYPVLTLLLIYLIAGSCAKQGTPSGGAKDTIPPTLLRSVPDNQSLNFKGSELYFEFDERVAADKIKQQLVITPTSDIEYTHVIKKNFLTIKLDGELADNTTYTFNFSDGVTDITERNPVVNFKLAISTGPFIDSMQVSGKVVSLSTGEPQKEILVALYELSDLTDSTDIFNTKPRYFSKTDEQGNFVITNIKQAKYRIYSWLDENKSLTLQSDTEKFGFLADTLDLIKPIDSLTIPIQLIDIQELTRSLAKPFGKYFDVRYSKYINDYDFILLDSNQTKPQSNVVRENKYIRFYNPLSQVNRDSIGIVLTAYDSLLNSITDTLFVKFNPSKKKPDKFDVRITPSSKRKIMDDVNYTISTSKPIRSITYDSIFIQADTLINFPVTFSDSTWNKNRTQLKFTANIDWLTIQDSIAKMNAYIIQEDSIQKTLADTIINNDDTLAVQNEPTPPYQLSETALKLVFAKQALLSIENDTSTQIIREFTKQNPDDLGKILVNINTSIPSYIIQLISINGENRTVVRETTATNNYVFNDLPAGQYTFRVIIDSNQDKRWNFGNYYTNTEPESVLFPTSETELKANWEVTIDLNF